MSDSLRKDELTTADIAGRGTPTPRQMRAEEADVNTPRQVRSEVLYRGPVPVPDRQDRDDRVAAERTGGDRIAPDTETVQVPSTAREPGPKPVANATPAAAAAGALFPDDELHNFRARWDQVQTSFVDEPRKAVEQADGLVANVVQRIAEQFSNERAGLEEQWSKGDNVNTEDLRQALRRYRAFFDRLLSF